jgi:hypothetical protein
MKNRLRNFFSNFGLTENQADIDFQNWFKDQKHKLESGEEIEPPWIAFPNSSPIHGWNQGYQEAWKNDVWLKFWNSLNDDRKKEFLDRWAVPSDDWSETLSVYWNSN